MPEINSHDISTDVWNSSRYIRRCGARGGVVVKALRYKPAGRGFDSRWYHWNFSVTKSFRAHSGPGVDSTPDRNEYQVYFLGVKAAGALDWQPYHHPVPMSWNLGNLTSWNPLGHSRPVTGLLYLYLTSEDVYIYSTFSCGTPTDVLRNPGWKTMVYNITDIPLCPKDDDDDEADQRALESKTPWKIGKLVEKMPEGYAIIEQTRCFYFREISR